MTDDKFFAWLDGELPADEAAAVERQVAADAGLSQMAADHRAMTAALRGAFDAVSAAPVPETLTAAAARPDNVVSMIGWKARLATPFARPASQYAAMAASLALGLFAGANLVGRDSGSPVEMRDGTLFAAGAVEQSLETALASAPAPGAVRIGLTFRDQSGAICRTFEAQAAAGLACRDGEAWRVRGLFEAPDASGAEFRMAAGPDPRLMELVDATIAGDPFDAQQEAKARQLDWR